jgi:lysophospholipase L1-like esterase
VVAALGDSITAGSPAWDPNPAVRRRLGEGVDPESQYEYWAQLRLKDTRFRNCGVFGERTDEISRRLERCAKGADVLIVQGGINDIAQMRDLGLALSDLRRMVRRGRQLGLRVVLAEVLPWNNGYPATDAPIRRLNMLIRQLGREERIPVLPWYELLEDPADRGRMKREWTADGDHPSVEGYKRLAETIRATSYIRRN